MKYGFFIALNNSEQAGPRGSWRQLSSAGLTLTRRPPTCAASAAQAAASGQVGSPGRQRRYASAAARRGALDRTLSWAQPARHGHAATRARKARRERESTSGEAVMRLYTKLLAACVVRLRPPPRRAVIVRRESRHARFLRSLAAPRHQARSRSCQRHPQCRREGRPGWAQRRRQVFAFSLLAGRLSADAGELSLPPRWRLGEVAQEMPETGDGATDFVLAGDTRLAEAHAAAGGRRGERRRPRHGRCASRHQRRRRLRRTPAAQAMLLGLGFKSADLDAPVTVFPAAGGCACSSPAR